MKKIALGLFGLLIVALAVVIVKRLSSDAMAVVVGIVAGIGASIPTMFVALWLMTKQEQQSETRAQQSSVPSTMVVNPAAGLRVWNFYGPVSIGDGGKVAQVGTPYNGQAVFPRMDAQPMLGREYYQMQLPRGEE